MLTKKYIGIPTEEMNCTNKVQLYSNWCWAACIKMVLRYNGITISQKEIVKKVFGVLTNNTIDYLNMTRNLNGFGIDTKGINYSVSAKMFKGEIPPSVLFEELHNRRPIILACVDQEYYQGHAVVVSGAYLVGNKFTSIIINDPMQSDEVNYSEQNMNYFRNTMDAYWLIDTQSKTSIIY